MTAFLLSLIFQATAAATPAPVVIPPVALVTKPKLICEEVETIGSRLNAQRVCMTKDQWIQRRHDDQDSVDRRHIGTGAATSGG